MHSQAAGRKRKRVDAWAKFQVARKRQQRRKSQGSSEARGKPAAPCASFLNSGRLPSSQLAFSLALPVPQEPIRQRPLRRPPCLWQEEPCQQVTPHAAAGGGRAQRKESPSSVADAMSMQAEIVQSTNHAHTTGSELKLSISGCSGGSTSYTGLALCIWSSGCGGVALSDAPAPSCHAQQRPSCPCSSAGAARPMGAEAPNGPMLRSHGEPPLAPQHSQPRHHRGCRRARRPRHAGLAMRASRAHPAAQERDPRPSSAARALGCWRLGSASAPRTIPSSNSTRAAAQASRWRGRATR
eukprot:scaffold3199_cov113-Isochrysis_galbana.AAC.4